jgi:hypothetical protein
MEIKLCSLRLDNSFLCYWENYDKEYECHVDIMTSSRSYSISTT